MTEVPAFRLPARYVAVSCLGRGGGGEVWAVRDRLTGIELALKALAEDAGESEVMALVREAVTLNGLEGLGVPRVLAFGSLPGSRRPFLVRELVRGRSLEEVLHEDRGEWLRPLAGAADQLTLLHRAGLLHGDIKPANVIVGPDGTGTLVDLGLSAPWREGGARARGLTPRFAAPELLEGEPLTVRAEVHSLGATLAYALAERGRELEPPMYAALAEIAKRATAASPHARHPSVDELASALRSAARLEMRAFEPDAAWPILGFDVLALELADAVSALADGEALALVGPARSGRSTLARRLAWSLGVGGAPVAVLEPPVRAGGDGPNADEVVALELDSWGGERAPVAGLVLIVDDLDGFGGAARDRLRVAVSHGARLVAVVDADDAERARIEALAPRGVRTFEVPPLDEASAAELLRRAVPSLPDKLAAHLLDRVERRPGRLRAFVRRLGTSVVTSSADVDEILAAPAGQSRPLAARSRENVHAELVRALDTGRFDAAAELESELGPDTSEDDATTRAIARARILAARGDAGGAGTALDGIEALARGSEREREWKAARARVCMRAGDFTRAAALAGEVTERDATGDAIASDALSVRGMALAFLGDESAIPTLESARAVARGLGDARLEAIALGSLGIAHQREGRAREAKETYEGALSAAETAQDAWTIASTRLNLANLAKEDGDLAEALAHLEAVVDLGRRAGGQVAVQQALFNLANLDLYVGRYARAEASIDQLAGQRERLAPPARAQLLGLQAELATRLGEVERGARLYALCGDAYDAVGRPLDAAEARLEGILSRAFNASDTAATVDVAALERELRELRERLGDSGFGKHIALASIVLGTLALARGDEPKARAQLDAAVGEAQRVGQREWAWRALDTRARLAAAQGASALARRDTEAALAMLEETAAKLPRDLREVFWNDPRRRSLRQAQTATIPAAMTTSFGQPRFGDGRSLVTGSPGRSVPLTSLGAPLPAEDRLVRIFEITRDLARETDLARLLQRVVDHAIGLVSAERGLVVLVNDEGEVVTHTARSSKGEESHTNFSRSVAEAVIRDGEPVIATSARDDERLAKAVSVHQLMIQSIACVPIRGALPAERTIGALYLETRLRPGVRFREELPTLAAFADQAAIAIENARLLDENRRRAEELAETNAELEAAKEKLSELLGRRTEQLASVRRDLKEARAQLRSHFGYAGLVGTSAAMRKLYAVIERVKDTDVPVLVTGESGTGKEMVAKAVHAAGPRGKQPFLGVNCGAIPENLLESELFGHVRGAFTGADRDRKGLFREAENGTILLDEIGEMPMKMQAGLLRVLQEKTVRPVGGVKEERCEARVVAATNRALEQMVAEGRFREDLFYRLHVIELKVPALRERAEDIPALVDHFLGLFAARHKRERKVLARDAVRRLQGYEWPGNVRQLEHVLLNAWLLSEGTDIAAEDLDIPTSSLRAPGSPGTHASVPPPVLGTPSTPRSSVGASAARPRSHEEHRENEKERILAALTLCNWNRVQAAKALGIPRRTFYRRLKDYGIV